MPMKASWKQIREIPRVVLTPAALSLLEKGITLITETLKQEQMRQKGAFHH